MSLRRSWHLLGLGLLAAVAVLAAVLELGPPTSSARTSREVLTAAKGVVQSTVSGSGNVEPGTDVEGNFQASGTLQSVYVKVGDHVVQGQLLATLDPTAAENTLAQAQESLTSAQDQLLNAQEATVTQSTSATDVGSSVEYAAFRPVTTTATSTTTTATTSTGTGTGTTRAPTTTAPTSTTTTATTPASTPSRSGGSASRGSGSSSSGSTGGSSSSGSSSGETAATKAANIASAQASVDGAQADVTNAETALHETHLYAPATGTVVSVESISPGDQVSGGSASSSTSSGSGSSASSSAGTGTTSAGSLGSSSASSSSSGSGFVEIVNTAKLTMTVAFSESDISKVKVGQPATVTLEALTDVELAAHVTSISTLGTTSNSVVSYNATLTLNQHDAQVRPGMSASASVITGQARGITLPNSAVTTRGATATVNKLTNGRTVSTPVTIGLQGDSRTEIVSGLSAGDQVVVTETLPSLSSSSSAGSSSSSGTLGGATGRLGGFGGGGGLAGGGGFARRFGGG